MGAEKLDWKWPVVPLCRAQLTDVNPKDILNDGLYRKCNTYKGGGGYDKFPEIYQVRYGKRENLNNQFVVQLQGCPLRCPYCYVTTEGVWGKPTYVSTEDLVQAFVDSGCEVFHLMGGAPARYIEHWMEIIEKIPGKIFHSDLLLVEKEYDPLSLLKLSVRRNCLYAISIKGSTYEEFLDNTNTVLNDSLFFRNLDRIVTYEFPFYFTFTGMPEESIVRFVQMITKRYNIPELFYDAYSIDIVHYNALDYKEKF